MTYVKVEQRIVVTLLLGTPGQPVEVEIERDAAGLWLKFPNEDYLVTAEVVEALYDVWQEVPVGSSKGRDQ